MEFKTITLGLAIALAGNYSFGQFTGDQDASFGTSGRLWYDWTGGGATSEITKLVLDENTESFYFSGSLNSDGFNASIVKATLDGELDETLPEGTINYDPFIGLDDQFEAVAVQDNGKIIGAGYSIFGLGNSDIIVARFETDGTFDPTFNGGAPLTFDEGGLDFATDVIIQEDGKIIVIGSYQTDISDLDLFFLRLNSDGSPDGTFGLGGVQVLDTYSGIELINSVTVLENGNIAAVGQAGDDVLIVQLDEDGNFDTDFSVDGSLNFKVNSQPSVANKLIELEDGNLLLSGNTFNEEEDGHNGFVIKLQSDGNFVSDFDGPDATLYLTYEEEMGLDTTFRITDMEVFENGQILLSADYNYGTEDIALLLVNADGTLDTEFGTDGMKLYNLSGGSFPNSNSQIEIASNGRVYLSAKVINGSFEDIVTWRLFADYTGIEEVSLNTIDFTIYPNPVSETLNLQFDNKTNGETAINIIDLSGRVVVSKRWNALPLGMNTISLSNEVANLPAGTYQIQMVSDQTVGNQPFVKH